MKRLQATVLGRVQGVGFRDYVLREGRALGLTGYVRNSDDGRSVEVVAEGDDAKLEALLRSLHGGPRFSRVERVDSQLSDATGGFARFSMEF